MHTSERNNSLVTEPSVLGSFTILVIFLPGAFLPFRLWQLHQELCLHWLFCQIRISLSSFKIGGWGVCAKKVATLKSPTGAGVWRTKKKNEHGFPLYLTLCKWKKMKPKHAIKYISILSILLNDPWTQTSWSTWKLESTWNAVGIHHPHPHLGRPGSASTRNLQQYI